MPTRKRLKRVLTLMVLLVLALQLSGPLSAHAEAAEQKVVRVGWFDSSFYYLDPFGRRCGIAYEYEHKIAAYTGWTYEYVEDSWPNLFQMLKDGELDILSDVSYRPERTEFMSFPDLPMGAAFLSGRAAFRKTGGQRRGGRVWGLLRFRRRGDGSAKLRSAAPCRA